MSVSRADTTAHLVAFKQLYVTTIPPLSKFPSRKRAVSPQWSVLQPEAEPLFLDLLTAQTKTQDGNELVGGRSTIDRRRRVFRPSDDQDRRGGDREDTHADANLRH